MSGGHETLPHRLAAAKKGVLIPERDEWTPFLLAMAKSGGEPEPTGQQKTATGSTVTVSDGTPRSRVYSLAAEIKPVQTGSGTASPDNEHPISGWNGVIITRNGQPTVHVTFPDEPGTVYSGSMDFRTGVLTVTGVLIEYGHTAWAQPSTSNPNGAVFSKKTQIDLKHFSGGANMLAICNRFSKPTTPTLGYNTMVPGQFFYSGDGKTIYFCWGETTATAVEFQTWVADHPLQIWAPLETPVTVQLDAQKMPKLAAGDNVFAADSGDVTVIYYAEEG